MREIPDLLASWNGFYAMIGSSAAALTGLMFVVISLARTATSNASEDGVSTFSSPTVVHFSFALFAAAVVAAPFRSLGSIEVILGIAGAWGVYYVTRTALRARRMGGYKPDADDWIWHVGLPLLAYATVFGAALALQVAPARALFALAAGVTLLIFIGIHNAWDVVTFLATGKAEAIPDKPEEPASRLPEPKLNN